MWTVYCEPINRQGGKGIANITEADIPKAIDWYQANTGQVPKFIALHPSRAGLVDKVPEGIEARFIGGCLAWEIWLSQHQNLSPLKEECMLGDSGGIMSTVADKKFTVDIIQPSVTTTTREKRRGPKHKELPAEKIARWAGEGMGSKTIAAKLKVEGVTISYKTIQRLLAGQRILI